jgi:hypothetical protein
MNVFASPFIKYTDIEYPSFDDKFLRPMHINEEIFRTTCNLPIPCRLAKACTARCAFISSIISLAEALRKQQHMPAGALACTRLAVNQRKKERD